MLEKRLSGTIHRTVSRLAGRKLVVEFKVVGADGTAGTDRADESVVGDRSGDLEYGPDIGTSARGVDYARSYALKPSFNFLSLIHI